MLSCTFGPGGTAGDSGDGPRSAGIVWQSRVRLSGSHSSVSPSALFRQMPSIRFTDRVAMSPTHKSYAPFAGAENANRLPSGAQTGALIGPGTGRPNSSGGASASD